MLVEFKNNIKIFTFKKMKFIKHVLLSSMQMHAKLFQKYKVWSPTLVVLFIKEPSECTRNTDSSTIPTFTAWIYVTPLPLFLEIPFHRTLWTISTYSILILKVRIIPNSSADGNIGRSLMRKIESLKEVWTYRYLNDFRVVII